MEPGQRFRKFRVVDILFGGEWNLAKDSENSESLTFCLEGNGTWPKIQKIQGVDMLFGGEWNLAKDSENSESLAKHSESLHPQLPHWLKASG